MSIANTIRAAFAGVAADVKVLFARSLPPGGLPGQIPVREIDGSMGWADPPPGMDVHGIPPGGEAGQVLTKASGGDYDAVWSAPSGGGGSGDGSAPTTVTRGFKSAVVSNDPDPLNAVGMGYIIRKEGPVSVVNYDAVKGDALTSPASSIPNLTMLRCGRPAWQNISLMLGSIVQGVMPKYLKKLQAGSWKGVARFTLENEGSAWGNFFVGVVAGNEAISGALRGWQFIDGSSFGAAAMAGIGFEFGDETLQFVWSFNDDAGTQRVSTNMPRSALLSEIHEARFQLNAERTHLIATLVHIPTGIVKIGPQLLPLIGGNLGYTMSIGRGCSAFDPNDYDNKYVGVASMTMETDY